MNNKLSLAAAAVIIAALSFYGGMRAAGISNPINVISGSTNIVGTVTAASASSITVTEDNGASKTISVGAMTRVLSAPTPKTLRDVMVGATVAVNAPGNIAQMIQIISAAAPSAPAKASAN